MASSGMPGSRNPGEALSYRGAMATNPYYNGAGAGAPVQSQTPAHHGGHHPTGAGMANPAYGAGAMNPGMASGPGHAPTSSATTSFDSSRYTPGGVAGGPPGAPTSMGAYGAPAAGIAGAGQHSSPTGGTADLIAALPADIQPTARAALTRWRRVRREAAPYIPTIVRCLLVATFVEDGVRVLFEMPHQVDFLVHQYYLPFFIAGFLLFVNVIVSFAGVALVVGQRKLLRGKYETQGSYLLLACVLYQQVMYGRHSPIGSGNFGFLIRNLCLAGSLILISAQSRLAAGHTALPLGLLDGKKMDKSKTVAIMQLASRILLVLLSLEFLSTLGLIGTIFTIPVVLAVLVGFHLEISGAVLLILYFLHNVLNSAFWSVSGSYMREIMRYEFVQILSIMGGLLMLINVGPGALSVDEMRGRKAY